MNFSYCGDTVPLGNAFCGSCGRKLGEYNEAANSHFTNNNNTAQNEPEVWQITDEVLSLVGFYLYQGDFGQKDMKAKYPHIAFDELLQDEEVRKLLKASGNDPHGLLKPVPKNKTPKPVISGHGDDDGSMGVTYFVTFLLICGTCVVMYFIIQNLSQYHRVDFFTREFGIRFINWIIPPINAFIAVSLAIAISTFSFVIGNLDPRFNSNIKVYEDHVTGFSANKEDFKLSYNEISSVNVSEKSAIDINVSGKVFTVWTKSCKKIAAEIDKRRQISAENNMRRQTQR